MKSALECVALGFLGMVVLAGVVYLTVGVCLAVNYFSR